MSRNYLFPKKKTVTDTIHFQLYQLYVQSAEKISERRQAANSFMWTINAAFISTFGLAFSFDSHDKFKLFQTLIAVQAIFLCLIWRRLIGSYAQLNTGKFEVIHEIEERLPFAPYAYEWQILGEGKDLKKYNPFSRVEMAVPIIFVSFWIFVLIWIFREEIIFFLDLLIMVCKS